MAHAESRNGELAKAADRPDLFGTPAPKAHIPDPRHVRNRLEDLLRQLRDAADWPWEPVIVRMHRDKTLPYLYGLLGDAGEARRWQADFDAEMTRLERAEAA